ncbi:hypothetical protein QO002_006255 [Pararhizobium capsulatum DSM 1112]|uniref:Uncharacterized protein n=1 Tax=Pararhizobium capsulatum DSM 1112 TaxID=1121113 RepID=A0ABU0C0J4_9HYPH|nr:hypothetical protein [Pararhizobium capsulatum DSM 1112]
MALDCVERNRSFSHHRGRAANSASRRPKPEAPALTSSSHIGLGGVRRTSPPFTSSLQFMKHTVAKRDKYHVRAPLFLARQFGGFLFASVPESGKPAFPSHTAVPKVSFWFPSPGSRLPSPTLQPSVGWHFASHGGVFPVGRSWQRSNPPPIVVGYGPGRSSSLATWPDGFVDADDRPAQGRNDPRRDWRTFGRS